MALASSVWSCSRLSLLKSAFHTKCAHDLEQQFQGTGTTVSTLLCEIQRREFHPEHERSREQTPAMARQSAFVPWVRWELILSREMKPKCRGETCGLLSNEPCRLNASRQGDGSNCASMTLCLVGQPEWVDKHVGIKMNMGNLHRGVHLWKKQMRNCPVHRYDDIKVFLRYFFSNYCSAELLEWYKLHSATPRPHRRGAHQPRVLGACRMFPLLSPSMTELL